MPKRTRPVEISVPPLLRDALMEVAVEDGDGTTSVRTLVETARVALGKVNEALASSGVAELVVKEMLRENRKRGGGVIRADARGNLTLFLGSIPVVDDVDMPHTTAPGGAGLPSLGDLRLIAEQRGVDISDLGRRKREIMQRLSSVHDDDTAPKDAPSRLRDDVKKGAPLHKVKLPR